MAERRLRATLLGTGTSVGIPVIGCDCEVCTSRDARDRRKRCSCYVEVFNGPSVVIDTGPDFRAQALEFGIDRVDAVLYTHHHFDHLSGIDDLRPYLFRNRTPMPCFAPPAMVDRLQTTHDYIFGPTAYPSAPLLDLRAVDGPFEIVSRVAEVRVEPAMVVPIPVVHDQLGMLGYRIGGLAYLTDTSHIPESSFALLKGVDVLVLDALRHEPHRSHFSFHESIAAAERIGARQTYFIHMTHTVSHARDSANLPDSIELAYDGLQIETNAG